MLERINQLLNFSIMKKSILSLKGAQELSKNEQKGINGGIDHCMANQCSSGSKCCLRWTGITYCVPIDSSCNEAPPEFDL